MDPSGNSRRAVRAMAALVAVWALCAGVNCRSSGSIAIGRYFHRGTTANWNNLGGDAGRSSFRPVSLRPPLVLAWELSTSSSVGAALIVSDSLVYFSTLDGRINAVDLRKGASAGQLTYYHACTAGLSVSHHTAVIGLGAGKPSLMGYNLFDRQYRYRKALGGIETNPVIYDDYVYLASERGTFYCLNLKDGEVIWSLELDKPSRSSPSVGGSFVYFGCDDGALYCVNRYNGRLIWKVATGRAIFAPPVLDEATVYVGSTDGIFYAVGSKDGRLRWRYPIGLRAPGAFYAAAAVDSETVYVGATDGVVYALAKTDGHEVWRFETKGAISVAPVVSEDAVFIGSQDHTLYAIDRRTGTMTWSYLTAGRVKTNPAIFGDYLIVASEGRRVYAFRGAP